MTYNECRHAVELALEADQWEEIGAISDQSKTKDRKLGSCRTFQTAVTLYDITHRTVVVHSDSRDERHQKSVGKQTKKEQEEFAKLKKSLEKTDYACLPDAQAAAGCLAPPHLHEWMVDIEPRLRYTGERRKAEASRVLRKLDSA